MREKSTAERESEEMDDNRILEMERHRREQIRELDLVELQVEEVDDHREPSNDELAAT